MFQIIFFKVSLFIFSYYNYLVGQVKDGSKISGSARKSCPLYEEIDQLLETRGCLMHSCCGGGGFSVADVDVPAFEAYASEMVARMRGELELEAQLRDRKDRHKERMISIFAAAMQHIERTYPTQPNTLFLLPDNLHLTFLSPLTQW